MSETHAIHHITGAVLWGSDKMTTREVVEEAVVANADLRSADLIRANLRAANLTGADLIRANLTEANLIGANLRDADLRDANLTGADLIGADLTEANLRGADLIDANLRDADLRGANLIGANLTNANLRGADLIGANLTEANLRGAKWTDGANLRGERPILQIGPIGSESGTLVVAMTTTGIMIQRGCYVGTLEEFAATVADVHGDNQHGREYRVAIEMVRAHAEIWTPNEQKKENEE